jgi:hypothetical protein
VVVCSSCVSSRVTMTPSWSAAVCLWVFNDNALSLVARKCVTVRGRAGWDEEDEEERPEGSSE